MDGRSADGSSIESDRSGYFPDQASGKFSEPKSQEKSETSIFTRNRWNANGGFATRRRIDINNVNNMPICLCALRIYPFNWHIGTLPTLAHYPHWHIIQYSGNL